NIEVEIVDIDGIKYEVSFPPSTDVHDVLESSGNIPLPPYIKRQAQDIDNEMYQTVFAKNKGSVAAPTASLHFTEDLIEKIRDKGVDIGFLTLHVGYGTFSPVKDPDTHVMHEEYFSIHKELHDKIFACKARSGKVWAVGTTVVRALESAFDDDLKVKLHSGGTRLFIRPPYRFKVVDRLITNFHHPSTSLMYLVSAFAGEDIIYTAYEEAVDRHYKLLSYGDAMLIIR
ncbi:MAG TPA: S-adenosylmethionine:tRNA ribosyltransferase-isomerase, partial [bacterium]|nr:S-adenosylmethionine:tRNA ribosyltransferase-isomerase [bacterium]